MEIIEGIGEQARRPQYRPSADDKSELLQQVYARGTWNRTPDHHVVLTYQSVPRQGGCRKRTQYLKDGSDPGDTAFNVWPVPVKAISKLSRINPQVHDIIFAKDVAQDSGAEDGSSTAVVQDLGDNIIRFPRELHDMFTREMICVWEIYEGVIVNLALASPCWRSYWRTGAQSTL